MPGDGGLGRLVNRLHGEAAEIITRIDKLTSLQSKAANEGNTMLVAAYTKQIINLKAKKARIHNRINRLNARFYNSRRGRGRHYKRQPGECMSIPQRKMKR